MPMALLEKGRKVVISRGSEYGRIGVVEEVKDGRVIVKLNSGKVWKGSPRHLIPLPEKM